MGTMWSKENTVMEKSLPIPTTTHPFLKIAWQKIKNTRNSCQEINPYDAMLHYQ